MKRIQRSALLPFAARQMYDLVNDVENYPEFLPWCENAEILVRDESEMVARLDVRRGGIEEQFTTRNALSEPDRIQMQLVEGPFAQLVGNWSFRSLGAASPADQGDEIPAQPVTGCKVELAVQYELSRALVGRFMGNFFGRGISHLMDAFCRRAESLYLEP